MATVSALLGPDLLGTGGPRIFESYSTSRAVSILGRWCSPVRGLVGCGRTGNEVVWGPVRLGSSTRPKRWTASFQWSNKIWPGFLAAHPPISFHPSFAESLGVIWPSLQLHRLLLSLFAVSGCLCVPCQVRILSLQN